VRKGVNVPDYPKGSFFSCRIKGSIQRPVFMHSNPKLLYQMLFGGIATGDVKRKFEARSNVFDRIEQIAQQRSKTLPANARGTAVTSRVSAKLMDSVKNSTRCRIMFENLHLTMMISF
jgi:hypothetical protein